MIIIVLSIASYKEKDAIITAISENETITFLARSILDPKSKNHFLNNVLAVADIEMVEGTFKYPTLKSAKQIFTPLKLDMNASYLGTLLLINEMTINLFIDEEKYRLFNILKDALICLKQSNQYLIILLIYMSHVMRLGGFDLEVNCCVNCRSNKKIVAFSFVEGGFICENCYDKDIMIDLSKQQMLLLRKIFNARTYELANESFDKKDIDVLLNKFVIFIEDAFGYRLKNIKFLA